MDIFNANRDQITDPDKIRPGQVLKIPQHSRK
jgi:nucleoid-associated protein YgaU